MSTENIKLVVVGVTLTFVAQVAVWFQHNWQFVNKSSDQNGGDGI